MKWTPFFLRQTFDFFSININLKKTYFIFLTIRGFFTFLINYQHKSSKTLFLKKMVFRDVSEKSVRGYTCLQKAVLANLPTFVTQLLNHGVNPNLYSVENPVRPVLLASYRGHYQVQTKSIFESKFLFLTENFVNSNL